MREKVKLWRMRTAFFCICLFLVLEAKNVYGTEQTDTQETADRNPEKSSEVTVRKADGVSSGETGETMRQETGNGSVQETGEKNLQKSIEGRVQEFGGENTRQDAGKKTAVKAKEIDLGDYQTTMEIGESQLLTVTVLPVDAADQTVTYVSSDEEVATVNSMGRIRANAAGTTKIKISCGSVKESFSLTVLEPKDTEEKTVAVTDIEISDYEKELDIDKTMTLTAAVLPADATEQTILYRSSDPSIATVNSTGEVKGIAKGDVMIYCSAGSVTKEVAITVKTPTEKLYVDNNYFVLKPGEKKALKTTVTPADASQAITYQSSNPQIANVSVAGVVTAKSCGNTCLIVSNKDASVSVSVIVNESPQHKTIEEGKESKNQITGTEFPEKMDVSETPVISSQMLNYFYRKNKTLSVHGTGYTILIHGEDIVNDKNELSAQIIFHREAGGTVFELNEGRELCGPITLCLDQAAGNYLYLYNMSKDTYQQIEYTNMTELKLTTGGKYLLTEKRLSRFTINKIVYAGGMLCCIVFGAVYVRMKKKYWFW